MNEMPLSKKQYWFTPIFLLLILFAQCIYFAWDTGQTVDETYYNGTGYPIVRYNDYRVLGEHPPLMMQLASLPLLFIQPTYPIHDPIYNENSKEINISGMGSRFLYKMGNNAHLILFLERIPMILVTMLLGLSLFLWARELYGNGGAALALTLFCFCPNMIANGSQLMTDMGVATFFFITLYRLKKFFDVPSVRNAAFTGLCAGLALVSKISSILLFPCILLLFVWFVIWQKQPTKIPYREPPWFDTVLLVLSIFLFVISLGEKLIFVAVAPMCLTVASLIFVQKARSQHKFFYILLGIIWLVGLVASLIFIKMIAHKRHLLITMAAGVWMAIVTLFNLSLLKMKDAAKLSYFVKAFVFIWLLALMVMILIYTDFYKTLLQLDVFSHYLLSFNIASTHSIFGHDTCVRGSWLTCDWKYFFGVIAIKTPVVTLALFGIGLLALTRLPMPKIHKAILIVPPVIFLLFASFVNQIHIGIRHILPIYPFIFLIAGGSIPLMNLIKTQPVKKVLQSILLVAVITSIVRNLQFMPHQLSYFNELVGNETEGVKHSTLNVGQDNKRLAKLIHQLNVPHFKIASISNNLAEYEYYGLSWSFMDLDEYEAPKPGYYVLDLDAYNQQQGNERSWFRNRKPDYVAGKILYVFEAKNESTL